MKKRLWIVVLAMLCAIFAISCKEKAGVETSKPVAEAFAPSDLHEEMFLATMSCWGEVYALDDYIADTNWKVYYDGTVEKYSFYHISGYTEKSVWKLDEEAFLELTKLLNGKFQDEQPEVDASDGEGWSMTYFDGSGNVIHTYDGYTYGLKTMERIQEIIDDSEGKEVTQEKYVFESQEPMLCMSLMRSGENLSEEDIMSGEWTLYHDGRLESGIRYLSADAYEMKEYQVSEADMQRIQELLKENFMESIQGEEAGDMWCFESFNIRGDDINFFYGDIEGIGFLKEIREILLRYCDLDPYEI